jgi:hypothetical protein
MDGGSGLIIDMATAYAHQPAACGNASQRLRE